MAVLRNGILALFVLGFWAVTAYCQTQTEINSTEGAKADVVDKKLNAIYQQVIKRYQANTAFAGKLRSAERAWIVYRDAYLHSIFPADDAQAEYGSVYPMCYSTWTQTVTEIRTDQLRKLLSINKAPATARASYEQEERKLNNAYKKVLVIFDKTYLKVLRQAERSWMAFRNADAGAFASLGPASDSAGRRFSKLAELNHQRTKDLQQWINGTEEGNVCAGSIPIHSVNP